jgi:hypothetical protein
MILNEAMGVDIVLNCCVGGNEPLSFVQCV